jgi:DMSO/TMAO reductase YedYZ molybdopterin-dependent catalytic subunit
MVPADRIPMQRTQSVVLHPLAIRVTHSLNALAITVMIGSAWRIYNSGRLFDFGYPMKIRIPTKLGFKNPKFVVALSVTSDYPGGFWEDYRYNWFNGS